ncbi:MAG: hypothetical protein ABFC85_09180, partial [Rectinema sp.]
YGQECRCSEWGTMALNRKRALNPLQYQYTSGAPNKKGRPWGGFEGAKDLFTKRPRCAVPMALYSLLTIGNERMLCWLNAVRDTHSYGSRSQNSPAKLGL